MKPGTMFFYPFALDTNRYARLQVETLRTLCEQIIPLRFTLVLRNCFSRRSNVAVLNFYEDRTSYHKARPNRTLIQNVAFLLFLRLTCQKIIWVRHNIWPHDLPRKYLRQDILLLLMRSLATTTVTHRQVHGLQARVAPHPLYFEGDLPETLRDIEFLFFGTIKRYKGLDALLQAWPKEYRLILAGAVSDPELFAELKRQAKARGLDVEFVGRFLSDSELDALLLRTKFVVLPHREDAMIVAGTFYHAASLGCNVLTNRSDFSKYLQEQFTFVNVFDALDIGEVVPRLAYVEAQSVVQEVRMTNGSARCRDAWKPILEL